MKTDDSIMRDLSTSELDEVSGGQCTCGYGKSCMTAVNTSGGTQTTYYNCSGTMVGHQYN